MKETLRWLMGIADGARRFHRDAAVLYPGDALAAATTTAEGERRAAR